MPSLRGEDEALHPLHGMREMRQGREPADALLPPNFPSRIIWISLSKASRFPIASLTG